MTARPQAIPNAHYLNAIANQKLSWRDALGEWIDNSFAAGATSVAIEFGKSLTVSDNGRGCTDLAVFATLGEHHRDPSGDGGVSMYGVGSKDAALWVGKVASTLHVSSVRGNKRRQLRINWLAMSKDEWRYDPVDVEDARPGEIGTVVTVSPVERTIPHGVDFADLVSELGYLYSPAIKEGNQITLRVKRHGSLPVPAPRWQLPRFDGDVINEQISVAGKTARVYCGIAAEGEPNPRRGMTYLRRFRVIIRSTQKGCGSYNISRVCGFVELGDSWALAKNKNGIVRDEEELFAAVEEACRPILERAAKIGMALASAAFETTVARALNAGLAASNAKAKRAEPQNKSGTKAATGAGSRHTDAQRKQPGATFGGNKELRVIHDHRGSDAGVGEFQSPIVYLNLDNPCVDQAHRDQNVLASLLLASSLICADNVFAPEPQLKLRGVRGNGNQSEDFSRALGRVMASQLSVDGRAVLKAV